MDKSNAWIVLQAARDSGYKDVGGREYHYPSSIPNGKRVSEGDAILIAIPARDATDGRRLIGIGQIGIIQDDEDAHRTAKFSKYLSFPDPLPFSAIGGDPRGNQKNSINPLSAGVVDVVLGTQGYASLDDLPTVRPPSQNVVMSSEQQIRDEFFQAVVNDLLGPVEGPDEEMLAITPTDRYLLGQLPPGGGTIEPEEFEELAKVGDTGASDDGQPEADAPSISGLMPSSMGMTFSVGTDVEEIVLTATWGRYERVKSDVHLTASGEAASVWKRTPCGRGSVVRMRDEGFRVTPDDRFPEVRLEGTVRDLEGQRIITAFLINGQDKPETREAEAWLFQPEIKAEGTGRASEFRKRPKLNVQDVDQHDTKENAILEMQYRARVEFAVGHGVGVHAEIDAEDPTRASKVMTKVVPFHDVGVTEQPRAEELPGLDRVERDMKVLSEASEEQLHAGLPPLVELFDEWIKGLEHRVSAGEVPGHEESARVIIDNCRATSKRIREGIETLANDVSAAEAFRFCNRAMYLQRIRSEYSLRRRRGEQVSIDQFDSPENRTWFPFQLAFILLNIPSLVDPTHQDRIDPTGALADLLWFPTGGGKTEAYLGVAAFTMALRRLQGKLGGYDGNSGVTVIMRYTLRLLTIQQFQRASTLLCAMEIIRRDAVNSGDPRWGLEPFRIGLWVGAKATPNTTKDSAAAIKDAKKDTWSRRGGGTPHQLVACPWCGEKILPGRDLFVDEDMGRTLMFCSDKSGQCEFTPRQAPKEGLPVLVVDEEIYRLLPSLLIATVDKFAQMPWKGEVQTLFGRVSGRCLRHGFLNPESKDTGVHNKKGALPKVARAEAGPLRPPDLIIQDELHLISGPLGTMVGLYENAVDELCGWELNGKKVRPKVVASTATIRRARDQVHSLFLRTVQIFPPGGLDPSDNFFARQRPISEEKPGRRYMGICAPGKSRPAVLIRVYTALLTAAEAVYQKHGTAADPWMTLIGYFNSLRELAGMKRLVEDDVTTRAMRVDRKEEIPRPGLKSRTLRIVEELTSRRTSAEIPTILDWLEERFDPAEDDKRAKAKERGERPTKRPIDVLLATNMLSVGVDVQRLGLMAVNGQPKNTAEYIQATSRIGRRHPGLVCTVLNWARPRDLSHYERFEHYHATFYQHVEALSVTPFAPRAIDRGLTALLVSLLRLDIDELVPNAGAGRFDRSASYVDEVIKELTNRAWNVSPSSETKQLVIDFLKTRLDEWAHEVAIPGRTLGYRGKRDGSTVGLLQAPGRERWGNFTILNSLRDVEPTVNLLKIERRGSGAPAWEKPPDDVDPDEDAT